MRNFFKGMFRSWNDLKPHQTVERKKQRDPSDSHLKRNPGAVGLRETSGWSRRFAAPQQAQTVTGSHCSITSAAFWSLLHPGCLNTFSSAPTLQRGTVQHPFPSLPRPPRSTEEPVSVGSRDGGWEADFTELTFTEEKNRERQRIRSEKQHQSSAASRRRALRVS